MCKRLSTCCVQRQRFGLYISKTERQQDHIYFYSLFLADGVGLEPTHRFPDDRLATCCLATRPTFHGIPTGNRTPDNGLGNRCVTTTPSRNKLAESGGVEPHPRLSRTVFSRHVAGPSPLHHSPKLVRREGLEPSTHGLEHHCSNPLSYRRLTGAALRNRTPDLLITSELLYQLS